MNIIEKTAPLSLFGLHKGDQIIGFDIGATLLTVRVATQNQDPSPAAAETKRAALQRFMVGLPTASTSTYAEIQEARLEHLKAKHLK